MTCATIHGIHCAVHGGGTRVEMNAGNGPHLFDLFMPEDILSSTGRLDLILTEANEPRCGVATKPVGGLRFGEA